MLKYNSKNFRRLNKRLDLDWIINGLGKQFRKRIRLKKTDRNNIKNHGENDAREQKNH